MKKLLFTLASLLVALTTNAYDSVAEVDDISYNVKVDRIYYNLDNSARTAEVTYKSGSYYYGNVSIPSSISYNGKEYDVISIGGIAFSECRNLESVTIPNSVKRIGIKAFCKCTGLTSVTIPNSVTIIEDNAFYCCNKIESVILGNSVTTIGTQAFMACSSLTSITIPNSVTNIGEEAFSGCSKMISVTLGSNLSTIEKELFYQCYQLKDVIIPENIKYIGKNSFYECYGLTSITIPSSVTYISDGAFDKCTNLTKVNVTDLAAWCNITSVGKTLFNRDLYLNNNKVTNLVIPTGVSKIYSGAFYGCSSLINVTLPSSMTKIGGSAFYGCSNLTSINIPNSVDSIGNAAFYGCSSLASVEIPSSIIYLADYAFGGCSSLKKVFLNIQSILSDRKFVGVFGPQVEKVVLGDRVTSIGEWTFIDYTSLTSIDIPNSVTRIGVRAFSGCSSLTSVTIPNSVTSIEDFTFTGCLKLTSITIPNSVTSIGDAAFSGCSRLASITIPNSVTSIGDAAFYGCSSLISIDIPNSVTSIGYSAFENCSGLTSVTIGNSVTSIGEDAFYCCSGLISIKVAASNHNFDSRNYCNAIIETASNTLITGCMNTVIPSSVTSIGDKAFYGCTGLTSITIPNGVTNIGSYAFADCSSLSPVTIPESVIQIGDVAFQNCNTTIYIKAKNRYYKGYDMFNKNHVYGFSYLKIGDMSGSYFHPYDVPHLKVYSNGFKLEGVTLQNYDDRVQSFDISGIKYEGYLDCSIKENTNYNLYYVMHTAKNGDIKGFHVFTTPKMSLTTLQPKVVNKGEVIVAASTNLMDGSENVGFEWRKYDAPAEIASKTGVAEVYDGKLEGIIKNLDASSYYKFRAYYKPTDGSTKYGDWIAFDPSDYSYFEPTVYTYDYVEVVNGKATFVGYVMQGSDDIISQGFEYWKDSTAHSNGFYAPSSGVNTVTATGQRMTAQVSGLTSDTTYGYRAFVKTNKGITYGEEYQFTTPVSDDIETIYVVHQQTAREGVYTLSGVKVANDLCESKQLPSGIYIVNGKKFVVK